MAGDVEIERVSWLDINGVIRPQRRTNIGQSYDRVFLEVKIQLGLITKMLEPEHEPVHLALVRYVRVAIQLWWLQLANSERDRLERC